MIRSDIRARIADSINDASLVFVTEAEANRSIDEAMEVIAERAKCIRRTAFVSMREGANFYFCNSIAADMMYPYRIWNETRNQRLTAQSILEMDGYSVTWLATQGTPEVWFPVSWDYFGVWPHPASSGGVMRIDYLAWPRALMDDSDEPELPESSTDALTFYGAYEGQIKEWDAASANAMYGLFQQQLGDVKAVTGINRVAPREFGRTGLRLPSEIKQGKIV
mgnify:CR=1 FL=1